MARQFFVNGNTMIYANGVELGLAEGQVSITINPRQMDINVSTFWTAVPAEIQAMLADATIQMNLVNFDVGVLNTCELQSYGASSDGIMPVAGVLMGATGKFISLNIASPVGQQPWTFPSAFLVNSPSWPLGNERSVVSLSWRAIPYVADPATAAGAVLFTH